MMARMVKVQDMSSLVRARSESGTFLENSLRIPPLPRNVTKLLPGLLQPTLQEGTGSFVSGGPYGPEGEPPP